MSYSIKAGDLSPGIAGQITPPAGVSLAGATLTMRYRGRTSGVSRDRTAVNDGETAPDSGIWAWHYQWIAGDTGEADEYELEISATVGGLPMTFPNTGKTYFTIEARLAAP